MKDYRILTGNQLKLLAMLTMTVDHIGLMLFPRYQLLRIIGRLSFPIFAYMIAEGCRYTKHRTRYLLSVLCLGLGCQLVYILLAGSLYLNILLTFSLSIVTIYLLERRRWYSVLWVLALTFVAGVLPSLLTNSDFAVDYGIVGVFLPVLVYFAGERKGLAMGIGLLLLSLWFGGIQWYCLLSLVPLGLYNGTRGKRKHKYLFYIYYPAHLVAIWLISQLFFRR